MNSQRFKTIPAFFIIFAMSIIVSCQSSDSETGQNQQSQPSSSVTGTSDLSEAGSTITIITACRRVSAVMTEDACRSQFIADQSAFGLGESVILILSRSVGVNDVVFQFDSDPKEFSLSQIDMQIARFSPGTSHTISARYQEEAWSNKFNFQVDELKPLTPAIRKLCASQECVPGGIFTAPKITGADALYPFVEFISGVAYTEAEFGWFDQNYLWAELSLDGNLMKLGCLNCALADRKGYEYGARIPFGDTGIFYNWDLKNLLIGSHSMKARLRNSKHIGPWSDDFIFEVEK